MTRSCAFTLSENGLVGLVDGAEARVVLALPGLPIGLGVALVGAHRRLPGRVLAIVDPDERVYRLGYGSFEEVRHAFSEPGLILGRRGLRLGCAVIDDKAFFLTLPPQLVEAAADPETSPMNAVAVEVPVVLAYLRDIANGPELNGVLSFQESLSPEVQEDTMARLHGSNAAETEEPKALPIHQDEIEAVQTSLAIAPPLDFQVHRQSMVYTSLLLYVEVEFSGARFNDRQLSVSKDLLPLLGERADLIPLHAFKLNPPAGFNGLEDLERRKEWVCTRLARNMGKPFGTVLLRKDLPAFEKEVEAIRKELMDRHPSTIQAFKAGLASRLDAIQEVCVNQCRATRTPGQILNALYPVGPRQHRQRFEKWKAFSQSQAAPEDVFRFLAECIREGLEDNLERMLASLEYPELRVTYREFTLRDMGQDAFLSALWRAFPHEKNLAPYLQSMAVLGKEQDKDAVPF